MVARWLLGPLVRVILPQQSVVFLLILRRDVLGLMSSVHVWARHGRSVLLADR
jgi:hypothetical protein